MQGRQYYHELEIRNQRAMQVNKLPQMEQPLGDRCQFTDIPMPVFSSTTMPLPCNPHQHTGAPSLHLPTHHSSHLEWPSLPDLRGKLHLMFLCQLKCALFPEALLMFKGTDSSLVFPEPRGRSIELSI